jgi:L-fuconolactonase
MGPVSAAIGPSIWRMPVEFSLDTFGFGRSMYGSDWHVLELAGNYPDWVDIVGEITAGCPESERRKLFRENAIAFYRLDA